MTGSNLGLGRQPRFRARFLQRLPQSEHGALVTADGGLSAEGLARVRNAVTAAAYGDAPVLARIAEATDDEIKSISNALVAGPRRVGRGCALILPPASHPQRWT